MNRLEHLLTLVSEESHETSVCANAAIRMGLQTQLPGSNASNGEELVHEFADLIAVLQMLETEGFVDLGDALRIASAKRPRRERKLAVEPSSNGTIPLSRCTLLLLAVIEYTHAIGKRATKALRFGLPHVQPGQELSNAARLVDSYTDLLCVMLILQSDAQIDLRSVNALIPLKKAKVERYLGASASYGTLAGSMTHDHRVTIDAGDTIKLLDARGATISCERALQETVLVIERKAHIDRKTGTHDR